MLSALIHFTPKHYWLLVLLCLSVIGCGSHKPIPVVDIGQDPYGAKQYYVAKGDTLYSISFRFAIDIKTLVKLNRLKAPYTIFPGQILNLTTAKTQSGNGNRNVSKVARSVPSKSSLKNRQSTSVYSSKSSVQTQSKAPKIKSSKKMIKTQNSNDKGWIWPVKGTIIGKFSTNSAQLNKGLDISAPVGTAIKSSRSGSVVYSGSRLKGYGKLIIVKHNNNYLSAYAHNQSILVKEGDWVKQGQKIATLGTSASSQPKLHFEIRKSGKPVDPMKYLAR